MPLCKPVQVGKLQMGWSAADWPFVRRAAEELRELGNKGRGLLALLRSTVQVQQSAMGGMYNAILRPKPVGGIMPSAPLFRLVLKASGFCIATSSSKEELVKDCQTVDLMLEVLAAQIESGAISVNTQAIELEIVSVVEQLTKTNFTGSSHEVETALLTLRSDEDELAEFEELGISGENGEGEDSVFSVTSTFTSQQPSVPQVSDEALKSLQAKLKIKRRAIEEKKRRFKWTHMSTSDAIELGDISGPGILFDAPEEQIPNIPSERHVAQKVEEQEKEKAKEKEKEKEKETEQTNNTQQTGPTQAKGEWVAGPQGNTTAEEWLWMEVPAGKSEEAIDEFYAVKPAESDISMDNFIVHEVELSADTTWMSRKELVDHKRYNATKSKQVTSAQVKAKMQWNEKYIPHTRHDARQALGEVIRSGVPDSKRGLAWQAVAGCQEYKRAYPDCYEDVIERVFGSKLPTRFYEVPQFGGELEHTQHYLNEAGRIAAHRVLWALAMENPEVDFAPSLPDAVCILQSFLSEADCYIAANLMIEQSKDDRWFFPISNKQVQLNLLTFNNLLIKYVPKLAQYMEALSIDASRDFAGVWFRRLFVSVLPYQTVLRIFDIYMNEGSSILYKIAIAILRVATPSLLMARDKEQFINMLQQLAIQYEDADHLFKNAFSFNSRQARWNTEAFDESNKKLLHTVAEPLYKPYYRPRIEASSSVLEDIHFEALWSLLESKYAIMDPVMIYSTRKSGFSLKTLLEICDGVKPVILIIKDSKGNVFGAFSSDGVRLCRRGEQYYGTTETFLFTLMPTVAKYTWLAGHARQFVRVTPTKLSFGDGQGLVLDEELWHGSSDKSLTFENAPLCGGSNTEFECVLVESYALRTPI